MDGGQELSSSEAEEDAWREIMLAYPMSELEVLIKHGAKWERNRLRLRLASQYDMQVLNATDHDEAMEFVGHTCSTIYDVGAVS